MLTLVDVVKHYPDGDGGTIRALDGISLSVSRGELAAVHGPSGSGKTSLLQIIAGLLAPDYGEVLVAGRDITALDAADAADYRLREIGYITQTPDLMPGVSALEQAATKLYGRGRRPREARAAVRPLLERLGLDKRLRHRPEQLSGGERQRVAIARALATAPRLVLADEPTGALDAGRSREVLQLLRELCDEQQVAMVLVTHDPLAADYADTAHTLRDGALHAFDTGSARAPSASGS
ncbi:ABC transporter ATP-binding protein [Conexibacter arvalis]|uniref:Putative ABC transport system ATP-binding protein n=1 Tax=Conexibacter arvalis TaxID=912552 RepID=A0A840IAV3_9ACTN|nr:ABC transporter ATP-binding protein [Conexibacter arvalis]MBB4662029.1 putative ABC transport system ATP-binding protein [Conexibacter arvalis]